MVDGCTDETAFNYDANANTDDGSCLKDCATGTLTDTVLTFASDCGSVSGTGVSYPFEGLIEVSLPPSVTEIKDRAFQGVFTLTTIDLSSVTKIGAYAFIETNLQSVTFPSDRTFTIGRGAFSNLYKYNNVETANANVRNFDLRWVTEIGTQAFFATVIDQVQFPTTHPYTIGPYAFWSKNGGLLTSPVNLGSVTSIAAKAFENAIPGSSPTVILPATATYAADAFHNTVTIQLSGCMNANAPNYNSDAEVDDGSCEEVSQVLGCTDETAFNYDANANTDDSSCVPVVDTRTQKATFKY